jgi:hypothetical protein
LTVSKKLEQLDVVVPSTTAAVQSPGPVAAPARLAAENVAEGLVLLIVPEPGLVGLA